LGDGQSYNLDYFLYETIVLKIAYSIHKALVFSNEFKPNYTLRIVFTMGLTSSSFIRCCFGYLSNAIHNGNCLFTSFSRNMAVAGTVGKYYRTTVYYNA
jgi:hypothetical protein